jgi:hypothetical protein
MRAANLTWGAKIGFGLLALFVALPLMSAERQEPRGGGQEPRGGGPGPMRAPVAERGPAVTVDRVNHGSLRHVDTHVVSRPAVVAPPRGGGDVHHNIIVHHDVDVDFHHPRFWSNFVFGRRWHVLPVGCVSVLVNGAPYYYDDGIYYQPADDGYQEVYPPVGADVPQPPDGAVAIDAGNLTYYYAGGAFYVEQNGGYVIAPPPIGVTVPELPPGAVEVSVNGEAAYQFNGIYYRPVFVNGVTQYVTFMP